MVRAVALRGRSRAGSRARASSSDAEEELKLNARVIELLRAGFPLLMDELSETRGQVYRKTTPSSFIRMIRSDRKSLVVGAIVGATAINRR